MNVILLSVAIFRTNNTSKLKTTFYVMIILKQTSNRHFAIILEMCYDNDISYELSKCYLIAIVKRNIYLCNDHT